MRQELIVTALGILAAVAVFAALFVALDWSQEKQCRERWNKSGFPYQYGTYSGCLIQLENGNWIPAANYRR